MSLRLRIAIAAGAALGASWAATAWARYCPSYTRGTSDGQHHCGVDSRAGKDPASDEWRAMFALAAQGPAKWRDRGPAIPELRSGCGNEKTVPATFPCEILKAMVQKESSWHQFCSPNEPSSEKGKPPSTLISPDCGYGATQVTSGMREGETARFDRNRVAGEAFYNLAVGASLLAEKWQGARCLENRDPTVLEHWYIALWKYNGYSYSNDPSNPVFSSTRGVYDPAVGGGAPYQEKVFGIIEKGAGKLWQPVTLAYPRIEDVAGRHSDPVAKVECASPTDCTQKRSTHRSSCNLADADPLLAATGGGSGGRQGTAGSRGSGTSSPGTGSSPGARTAEDASVPGSPPSGGCHCEAGTAPAGLAALSFVLAALSVLARHRRR